MSEHAIHTPGRIRYYENGEANSYAMLEESADGRWLLTMLHNGHDITERQIANMRRLVACWNACEGIPTENLERAEGDTAPVFSLLMATTAQRDELLEALHTALPFVEDAQADPCYKPTRVRKAISDIRAAIAKARGEA